MRKPKQTLIVGTSTDIGKTFVTCKIIDECRNSGALIDVIKPVITGFNAYDEECDSVKILRKLGAEITEENLDETSPIRLKTPISPISAAEIEGIEVDYQEILQFCRDRMSKSAENGADLVIETAGGVMTPICKNKTFLDLAEELDAEIILIGACFLGGISNILTNYEALRSRNIEDITILVNNNADFDDKYLKIDDFIKEIGHFVDCEVFLVDNFFYLR